MTHPLTPRSALRRMRAGLGVNRTIAASRLPGTETIVLGGGEMVPTPGVAALPVSTRDRRSGLAGDSLALPPAAVRILNDVHLDPAQGVVFTPDGAVVLDSVATERLALVRRPSRNARCEHRSTVVAPYGVPGGGPCEALLEALPRALLLQHPALRRHGAMEIVRAGAATPVEEWLLAQLEQPRLRVVSDCGAPLVAGRRVMVPSPLTRCGAGAVPRWFGRWIGTAVAGLANPEPPRRVVAVHGPADPLRGHWVFDELVERFGFAVVDTAARAAAPVDTTIATLRDAITVVGGSDDALAHALLARRAEILEIGLEPVVSPRIAQLCLSLGLPFEFLRPEEVVTRVGRAA